MLGVLGVLVASNGQRPGMPLNLLQCTGQPLQQRSIQNVKSAEVEKPCSLQEPFLRHLVWNM